VEARRACHQPRSTVRNVPAWISGGGLHVSSPDGLKWKELEIILLVKPSALQNFDGKTRSGGECQGIDNQLVYRIDFASLGLIVEQVDETISGLLASPAEADHRSH
jgi:hypothetical protein